MVANLRKCWVESPRRLSKCSPMMITMGKVCNHVIHLWESEAIILPGINVTHKSISAGINSRTRLSKLNDCSGKFCWNSPALQKWTNKSVFDMHSLWGAVKCSNMLNPFLFLGCFPDKSFPFHPVINDHHTVTHNNGWIIGPPCLKHIYILNSIQTTQTVDT